MSPPRFATLADGFASFASVAIPPEASEAQRTEMRRAFYAGAAVLFNVLTSTANEEDEASAHVVMSALDEEILQFARDVTEGKA